MRKGLLLTFLTLLVLALGLGFAVAGDEGKACNHSHEKAAGHGSHEKAAGHAAEGHSCAVAAGETVDDPNCPMHGRKAAEVSEVTLTGSVLCAHCDLQLESKCRKVFQEANDEKTVYGICPHTDLDAVSAAAGEEKSPVKVSGKLARAEDGTTLLMISKAEKN
jgi:hypothetical protein